MNIESKIYHKSCVAAPRPKGKGKDVFDNLLRVDDKKNKSKKKRKPWNRKKGNNA